MEKSSKIYIAGHTGLVGSAIHRKLVEKGYTEFILRTLDELDLTRQADVENFFQAEKPEYVILAAAKVGGIMANNTYRAQFIYENLMIQNNIIHNAWVHGVKKLLFLGSSCIYPKEAPQPLKEEYLLTGGLEYTNEPYAIAKIAGIKMCESYNRQYGCNFLSVMPTNLYGPNDNYDLEKSHVLPAIIRKMHLAKCLEQSNWAGIRRDLDKRPVEGVNGKASEAEILGIFDKYGIHPKSAVGSRQSESSSAYPPPSPPYLQVRRGAGGVDTSVTLWGTGNVYREFLHVDDMADACVFVMEKVDIPTGGQADERTSGQEAGNSSLHHYITSSSYHSITFLNIGTGRDLTIRELAEMVKEIVGFTGQILWDPSKPDGTYKKQLDVTRLHEAGWREKTGLEEGIRGVYREYCEQV